MWETWLVKWAFNTLRPRQNEHHFADGILKCIFLNENAWISLKIPLNFVPKVRINNIPASVLIMAWRRPGDKPLSEPMMVWLLTHMCATRPQWVNELIDYILTFEARYCFHECNLLRLSPNLVGMYLGARSRPSSFMGVLAHYMSV